MNIRQNDSASCRNTSTCFERRITLEKTEHLDEADLIVVADLNPRYFYDDEIEDLHEDCSVDLMIGKFLRIVSICFKQFESDIYIENIAFLNATMKDGFHKLNYLIP